MKRLLIAVIAALLFSFTVAAVIPNGTDSTMIGDVNADGRINATDTTLLFRAYLGLEVKPSNICHMDLAPLTGNQTNPNSIISIADVVAEQNLVAGKIPFQGTCGQRRGRPVWSLPANVTINAFVANDNVLNLPAVASDNETNSSRLTFSILSQTTNCSIDSSKMLDCTGASVPGTATVALRATDSSGMFADSTLNVVTAEFSNSPPVISSLPSFTVSNLTVFISNIDLWNRTTDDLQTSDTLAYSVADQTDTAIANCFVRNNRFLNCRLFRKPGITTVTVAAADSLNASGNASFTITVFNNASTANNTPPSISPAVSDITSDGSIVNVNLSGSMNDAEDSRDNLTWSISGVDASLYSAAFTERDVLTITPTGVSGSDTATLTLTDSGGLSAAQSILVTIAIANGTNATNQTTNQTNQTTTAGGGVSIGSISFGSNTQKRGENTTATTTITNSGSSTLTNIRLSTNADSKFHITFTGIPSSIAAGQSASVTAIAFVPRDLDAVDADGNEISTNIGTATATASNGTSTLTASNTMTMQARNLLNILRGKISIDGKDKSFSDGTRVDKIKPGEKMKIKVKVENKESSSEDDNEIEGELSLDFSSNDFNADDNSDTFNIANGDDDELTFDVDVEDNADAKTSTLEIRAIGTDRFGARHGERIRVSLEVKRENHDLDIRTLNVQPTRIGCTSRTLQVTSKVLNLGRGREDEVLVEAVIPALGLSTKSNMVDELDEDDEESFTASLSIPQDAAPGSYEVQVFSVYDASSRNNQKNEQIQVDDCRQQQTTEQQPETTSVTITQPTQAQQGQQAAGQSSVITQPQQRTVGAGTTATGTIVAVVAVTVVIVGAGALWLLWMLKVF